MFKAKPTKNYNEKEGKSIISQEILICLSVIDRKVTQTPSIPTPYPKSDGYRGSEPYKLDPKDP